MATIINGIINLLVLLIIINSILSFIVQDYRNPFVATIHTIVEPILAPFRRIIPPMGGLDFSPVAAILALQILGSILTRIFR
ncbi:MAG TPA: YggT family protein [Anaerolineales bacterium]|nr:YggT family protein [Anaerolineales bacterium]